jgi:hypothetical protein
MLGIDDTFPSRITASAYHLEHVFLEEAFSLPQMPKESFFRDTICAIGKLQGGPGRHASFTHEPW